MEEEGKVEEEDQTSPGGRRGSSSSGYSSSPGDYKMFTLLLLKLIFFQILFPTNPLCPRSFPSPSPLAWAGPLFLPLYLPFLSVPDSSAPTVSWVGNKPSFHWT